MAFVATDDEASPIGFTASDDEASPVQSQGEGESFLRGALRNVPLAQQAVSAAAPILNPMGLAAKPDYSGELQHLTDAAEQGKAQNPKSYGAGAVAGTLAPLAVPFAGEALGASGPALDIASGAGVLGGAANSAAQSLSDTNLRPSKITGQDLKSAGESALAGGALGALFKGAQAVAPSAKTLEAEATSQGLGATYRRLFSSGILNTADPQAELSNLGKWVNEQGISGLAKRPDEMLDTVKAIHDQAGKEIGALLEKVAPDASIPKASLTANLYPLVDEYDTISPTESQNVLNVISKINKLSDAGRLDLPALNKIKSTVGEQVANSPAMARTYGSLADSINGVVDEYGRAIKDPNTRLAYDTAKMNYRNASKIIPILNYSLAKMDTQGVMGNSGLLGMFGLASGVAAGHPLGGAAAMIGSSIGRPVGNLVGRNAALKAVPYMPAIVNGAKGLSRAAQLELTNALTNLYGKKK